MQIKGKRKPALVVMAAGMGSRYGGLKQIDPVTDQGEIIMDFSLYDAMLAGFTDVIFVIRDFMESDLREMMDGRAGKHMDLHYAIQSMDDLPEGFCVPEGREKPWGTGHAILAARHALREIGAEAFAVINADDYYGPGGFQLIYDFLSGTRDENAFCMIGYELRNTMSENGSVNRGVCNVNKDGYLNKVTERTGIRRVEDRICYEDPEDGDLVELGPDTPVSMNFWGYTSLMLDELERRFPLFLEEAMAKNPLKGEYQVPSVTDDMIRNGIADVRVLTSDDRWYGVTYKEDKETVESAFASMKDKGIYPDKLWK